MKEKSWIVDVQLDQDGSAYIQFTDEMLEGTGWREGDTIQWINNNDGSWTMKKKEEMQWVLVECISTFRQRYLVETPVGADKADWALDSVEFGDAKEFSQKHLGETAVSHRVVSEEEALRLCVEDNDYCKNWSDEKKKEVFFTGFDYNTDNDEPSCDCDCTSCGCKQP